MRKQLIFWLGLTLALFQLIVPMYAELFEMQLRAVHVLLTVSLILVAMPIAKEVKGWDLPLGVLDGLLILVVIAANALVFFTWEDILTYSGGAEWYHLALGGALSLVLLDAARRATGWAIPVCVMLMFAYVFVGPYMPGQWTHPGFPLTMVLENMYYSSSAIYGSLTGTSATFIAMFILFGALLHVTGGGQTFMDIALYVAGRFTGGPAKVCIVASCLFGMISGSAVANVSVTGAYTIPLMRRLGYDPDFAGGVESMSSTGGAIAPPVMGIAAFIMADYLGIPYLYIMGYAVIPCVLFYAGIVAGVHFEAARLGLKTIPPEEIPHWREVFTWAKIVPLFVPIVILLVLLFMGWSLTSAGFYACVAVIAFYIFSDLNWPAMKQRGRELFKAFAEGGRQVAQIAPILVCVGMFSALLGLTGVAPKISTLILELGGATLIGSLMVAAIVPLLLGAPLPVTATYILSAALIAPALVKLGLDVVGVHMFLLYWATLASVTPPTCTACVVAANISGGNWFRTSIVGMKLGIVGFIIPFYFVPNPALLGRAPWLDVVGYATAGIAGSIFLAAGFFGYFRSHLNYLQRAVYFGAGGLLLAPDPWLALAGGVLALASIAAENLMMRTRGAAAA